MAAELIGRPRCVARALAKAPRRRASSPAAAMCHRYVYICSLILCGVNVHVGCVLSPRARASSTPAAMCHLYVNTLLFFIVVGGVCGESTAAAGDGT